MSEIATFRDALDAMKPIRCAHCGRAPELPAVAVDGLRELHHGMTAAELRGIALLGTFIDGWGMPVDAQDTFLDDPTCPRCATAAEHAHAGLLMLEFHGAFSAEISEGRAAARW